MTTGDDSKYMSKVTGKLAYIKLYAKFSFNGYEDQELTFILTTSSFVISLHKKSVNTTFKQ